VCLWAASQAKGYERGEWGTYQQWQERGAQVRKGEKATLVVFWKFANSAAETDDGDDTPKSGSRLLFTRGYSVFNAAQVDGYTPKFDAETPIEQRIESAEQFFARINARVASRQSGFLHSRYGRNHATAVCCVFHTNRLLQHEGPSNRALDIRGQPLRSAVGQALRR
jgi:antirestriction protein ArdC